MPPKRAASSRTSIPTKRPSKLAKENDLTADQEAEIREAFSLFAIHHPDHEDAEEGVLKRDDVRRCLISLNLPPEKSEVPSIISTIDPLNTGYVRYEPFVSYASIAIHSKESDSVTSSRSASPSETNVEELHAAYRLFTHGSAGPITMAHLRRVAKELREDVSDDVLRDMILEANGGVKRGRDVGGVGIEDFEGVMKRAGVSFG